MMNFQIPLIKIGILHRECHAKSLSDLLMIFRIECVTSLGNGSERWAFRIDMAFFRIAYRRSTGF